MQLNPLHAYSKRVQLHRPNLLPNHLLSLSKTLLTLFLFACTSLSSVAQQYTAMLSGRQEALPIVSSASGQIKATLDGNSLVVTGSFSGLSGDFDANIAGGSHVHLAYAGQNGGISFRLNATLSDDLRSGEYLADQNTFTLTDEQLTALHARQLYVNIHTQAFPSGELRGQLLPTADTYYFSNLSGNQEVPAIMSGASGALALEKRGDQLVVTGGFQQLEGEFDASIAGGAHLHLGYAGANGGIQLFLTATTSEDLKSGVFEAAQNTFTLNSTQMRWLEDRQLYANIHTKAVRSGELRGQILGMAKTVFRAHLSGSNEIPAVTSFAHGMLLAELMPNNELIVSGSFADLESKFAFRVGGGAHIHRAMAGSNGGVRFRLAASLRGSLNAGTFQSSKNTFELSEEDLERLYNRGFYVNLHSFQNRSGELRGQLLPESQIIFNAYLSSIFTSPSRVSTASGGVVAELNGAQLRLSGSFNGLLGDLATNIAGGAHIHLGAPGINGGVEFVLNATLNGDQRGGTFEASNNVFDLSDDQVANLRARKNYVNLHSTYSTSGEIRAQLLPDAYTYFLAPLSGASELTPVNSPAKGLGIIEVNGDNGFFHGAIADLSSPLAVAIAGGAHIHRAPAGRNGPIEVLLNATPSDDLLAASFSPSANRFTINRGLRRLLRNRGLYVNIHSERYRSGELRGQILPLSTAFFTSTFSGLNEVQPNASTATGGVKLELSGNVLTLSGSFDNLAGELATNIAGGSHLHLAAAGNNGPLNIRLKTILDGDKKGALYPARINQYQLDPDQINSLLSGDYYVNIHSTSYLPGEIRGQVLAEVNAFPTEDAVIETPLDGSAISIEGDPNATFSASWGAADDRDALAYTWQLSSDENFSTILLQQNVGGNLSFSTDFASVDALLAAAGISVGESLTLYHRAIASDGSLFTPGATASVQLHRGSLDTGDFRQSTEIGQLSRFNAAWNMKVFPTVSPSGGTLSLEIESATEESIELWLFSTSGQVLKRERLALFPGLNRHALSLSGVHSGLHFLQLQAEGKWLPAQKIIVE